MLYLIDLLISDENLTKIANSFYNCKYLIKFYLKTIYEGPGR